MKSKWATYKELELIPDSVANPNSVVPLAKIWMRNICNALLSLVINNETIRIWKKTDGIGHTWWYVYDPATHLTHYFASEGEVRVWLESRYYNRGSRSFMSGVDRIWH